MEELKVYYANIIESGTVYKSLLTEPLNSNVALKIQKTIDDIEYNVKLYHHTLRKLRQLTDEEKQMMEFKTPKEKTVVYFHTHRKYPTLSENLKKLIKKIKEREVKQNEKNSQIVCNADSCNYNIVRFTC